MPAHRCREPLQIEQKALVKMRAVARNIDFVSVSEKAPAGGFAWVAVRVGIICCYTSAIPQPICEAMAELFSCRPNRGTGCLQTHERHHYPFARNRATRCAMTRPIRADRKRGIEMCVKSSCVCSERTQFVHESRSPGCRRLREFLLAKYSKPNSFPVHNRMRSRCTAHYRFAPNRCG